MKHQWTYHVENSLTKKNGEKLWYLDLGFDPGYEMEITQTDDGPFITYCYKGPQEVMPKLLKKKKFKSLNDAKNFGVLWLIDGLKTKSQELNAIVEALAEEVLTHEMKEAYKPKKKKK